MACNTLWQSSPGLKQDLKKAGPSRSKPHHVGRLFGRLKVLAQQGDVDSTRASRKLLLVASEINRYLLTSKEKQTPQLAVLHTKLQQALQQAIHSESSIATLPYPNLWAWMFIGYWWPYAAKAADLSLVVPGLGDLTPAVQTLIAVSGSLAAVANLNAAYDAFKMRAQEKEVAASRLIRVFVRKDNTLIARECLTVRQLVNISGGSLEGLTRALKKQFEIEDERQLLGVLSSEEMSAFSEHDKIATLADGDDLQNALLHFKGLVL